MVENRCICIVRDDDILTKNKEIHDKWSKEKQKIYFWFWNGVTNYGETIKISPYETDFMERFDSHCNME